MIAGGWDGHQPEKIVHLFAEALTKRGFEIRIEQSLDCLTAIPDLASWDLIFPCWTMGQLTKEQSKALREAVRAGAGLGGIHGGMGDAFRGDLDYEWMVGGHFVGHPHVGDYTVRIADPFNPITAGLPATFAYQSEQYYMMVDPGIHSLADTVYSHDDQLVTMPVAWIKRWGAGRVFYCALGHKPEEFETFPAAMDLTMRGLLWAARAL
jgi:uncharacterized protein